MPNYRPLLPIDPERASFLDALANQVLRAQHPKATKLSLVEAPGDVQVPASHCGQKLPPARPADE